MKQNLRKLIQEAKLLDQLPHGAIEELSQDLNTGRASIRGALKGDWLNTIFVDKGLEKIEARASQLQSFIQDFKPPYESYKEQYIKSKKKKERR